MILIFYQDDRLGPESYTIFLLIWEQMHLAVLKKYKNSQFFNAVNEYCLLAFIIIKLSKILKK